MKTLKGIHIPATTAFDSEGRLRLDWLRENVMRWCGTPVAGIMALGSNGEFRSMDDDESLAVLRTVSETISEEKVFMAGVGRESLELTLRFVRRLEKENLKIDYLSVLTPSYFKKLMTDEALIGYYTAVADASPWPLMLYSAPGFANQVYVTPEAVRELASHPNIVGLKDTTPDQMEGYLAAAGGREDFSILAGSLGNVMKGLSGGCAGGILSAANYFPAACSRFYQIFADNGADYAAISYEQLKKLGKETGGRASVAGVKAAMNVMGYSGGVPRLPVLPCSEEEISLIRAYIEENREFILDCEEN